MTIVIIAFNKKYILAGWAGLSLSGSHIWHDSSVFSIENAITRGTLHLLCHFVAKVLDDQLQWCKRNTAVNTSDRDGHVKSKLHAQRVWIITIEMLMSLATLAGHLQSAYCVLKKYLLSKLSVYVTSCEKWVL